MIRGDDWVYRAVFRPPSMVSIGSSPSAVMSLPGSDLPEYHELIRIFADGGVLFFQPGMAVELRVAEGLKRNDQLLDDGLAVKGVGGWRVPLGRGTKGAFRVGDVAVLFKVRPLTNAAIRPVVPGEPPRCGTCDRPLKWAVVGFGALTPCSHCGAFSEVQNPGTAPESRRTEMAPVIKRKPDDLPTFDAISVRAPTVTPQARVGEKIADLPTFDAISAGMPAVPEDSGAPDAVTRVTGSQLSMPTRKLKPRATPRNSPWGMPPKGADLPTFDAISVGHIRSEMLTGGASEPDEDDGPETLEDAVELAATVLDRPAPKATTTHDGPAPKAGPPPSFLGTSPFDGISESVADISIEEEGFFAGDDDLVSIDLQRSYSSLPVLNIEANLTVSEAPARRADVFGPGDEETTVKKPPQQLGPSSMVDQAKTLGEVAPASFRGGVPSEGRRPAVPDPGRVAVGHADVDVATAKAPAQPEVEDVPPWTGPLDQTPVDSGAPKDAMASRTQRSTAPPRGVAPEWAYAKTIDEEGSDEDDFLMGRSSLPEMDPVRETNRWLIFIGAVSGILGLLLILYSLFS